METKVCSRCEKEKPISEFYKDSRTSDGLYPHCRECHESYVKEWKEENSEYYKKIVRKWRERNPEKGREYSRKWRENNKEQHRRNNKRWKKENKEYYLEQQRKYKKKKRKENPRFRINGNIGSAVRDSLREDKNGHHWEELVGYTLKELKQRLECQFEKGMSWDNWGRADEDYRTWHIDHKKPKSKFDFDSPKDQAFKDCWALANLQPLWAEENLSKQNYYEN